MNSSRVVGAWDALKKCGREELAREKLGREDFGREDFGREEQGRQEFGKGGFGRKEQCGRSVGGWSSVGGRSLG